MATKKQIEEFIKRISPIAAGLCPEYGISYPSAVIAHACNESNYGTSALAAKYNNLFGMKKSSSWKGRTVQLKTKEEYKKGVLTPIYATFKVFGSYKESVEDYLKLVTGSYYTQRCALKNSVSYADYIDRLMPVYCTSTTQATTLKKIVATYGLTAYDRYQPIEPARTLKKGCKGADVIWLQMKLGNLKVDGIFGKDTEAAVKVYQKINGLTCDGIVGKQTLAALKAC